MKVETPIDNRVKLKELNNGDVFSVDDQVYMILEFRKSICEIWDFQDNKKYYRALEASVIPWPNAILKL